MAQVPYEFLVRFDHLTGLLKGAHVKVYDNVTMKEGDAQSVEIGGASGFPLSEILTTIETGALLAMEQAQSELAAEKTAHEATRAELAALKV